MKKLNLPDKIVFIVNTLVAFALLFSYLLPYISPKTIPLFAVLSLLVPLIILINLIFALYWLIKLKKQFLLSSFILLIGWTFNASIYKFSTKKESVDNSISVMSYNVRMFNYWNWIDEKGIKGKIISFIKKQNPDFLMIQESYGFNHFEFPYQFVKKTKHNKNVGLVIYSKYPIINSGSLEFKSPSNNAIFADIIKEKDTIRIYNVHLQSFGLSTDKENFGLQSSDKLLDKLEENFSKQADQINLLIKSLKDWKGKKIVGGDFNNTSRSWVYNQITNHLLDAHQEAGEGFGKTYNYWFPLRIDFIFTDFDATITSFQNFTKEKNSDHFPILAKLNW